MRNQLILVSIISTMLAWVGGVALTMTATRTAMERLHDRELIEIAVLLHGLSGHELIEVGGDGTSIAERIANARGDTQWTLADNYRYQVWSKDGRLLLTNFGQGSGAPMSKFGNSGLSWLDMDGERWRVYAHYSPVLEQEVHVAERLSLRELVPDVEDGVFPLLVLCSLLVAIGPALLLSSWLMRPMQELVTGVNSRSAANLKPFHVKNLPADLQPVVAALNRLFGHVADALRREAAFTALAAHELRTPLATLRILAKTAAGTADTGERTQAIGELVRSADRCAHLQEQLLTLSRLETQTPTALDQEVDLTEVVVDVIADLGPEARDRHVKLASQLDGSAIFGHRFGVLTLVRNLVSNAVRYTPANGRVEVVSSVREGSAFLTVDDSGPGIPASERERVFERFHRLQRDQTSGVGLGLSIVSTVAAMHGALVTLSDSPLGGLRVTVEFRGRVIERELLPATEESDFA